MLSPLKVNLLVSILKNQVFRVNTNVSTLLGTVVGEFNGDIYDDIQSIKLVSQSKKLAHTLLQSSLVSQESFDLICNIGSNTCPALSNSLTITDSSILTNQFKSRGLLDNVLNLAQQEINFLNTESQQDLVWSLTYGYSQAQTYNELIASLVNAQSYMENSFTNLNDIITADITSVTSNPLLFGQDLIAQGRVLDLAFLSEWGKPSTLLKILHKNKALSMPLSVVLNSLGIESRTIKQICNSSLPVSIDQERTILRALKLIRNRDDLRQSLVPLNCQLKNIESLADLLNVKKLFPSSWKTIFWPNYDIPENYPLIRQPIQLFVSGQVNQRIIELDSSLGKWLNGIFDNLTTRYEFGALVYSMYQIKDIESMSIEAFAQVCANMETVNDLNLINTVLPSRVNPIVVQNDIPEILTEFVQGTGEHGTIKMIDLFGAASGLNYQWYLVKTRLNALSNASLVQAYQSLFNTLQSIESTTTPNPPAISSACSQANSVITSIVNANRGQVNELNAIWETNNAKLETEIKCRGEIYKNITETNASKQDVVYFVTSMIDEFNKDITALGAAAILENITSKSNIGGQSLIGTMRESRNAARMQLSGTSLDNNISPRFETFEFDNETYTPKVVKVGNVSVVKITGDPSLDQYNASIYGSNVIEIDDDFDGSLSGSSQSDLVRNHLDRYELPSTISQDIATAEDSVDTVVKCSCDF